MPKLAATLASLLLIASSIGVNIARYPRVGRVPDPGRVAADEPANSAPATAAPPAEPVNADSPAQGSEAPAGEADAQASNRRGEDSARPSIPMPVATVQPPGNAAPQVSAAAPVNASVPIVDVRPMVPVGSLPPSGGNLNGDPHEVRRLPPIESGGLFAAPSENVPTDYVFYPTTATP